MARANLPPVLGEGDRVRREELLKSDSMSEVILLVAGLLVAVILLLILVVALTQPSAHSFQRPHSRLHAYQRPVWGL